MEKLHDFCDSPTPLSFGALPEKTKEIIFDVSKQEKYRTNSLARKVITFYQTRHLSDDAKRGLRATLLAVTYLRSLSDQKVTAKIHVFVGGNKIYSVKYNPKFEAYYATEDITIKKYLYFNTLEDLKEHTIETISQENLIVTRIILIIGDEERQFYIKAIGVVWGLEDCVDCYNFLKSEGIDCSRGRCDRPQIKNLLRKHHPDKGGDAEKYKKIQGCYDQIEKDECYERIRHRPD